MEPAQSQEYCFCGELMAEHYKCGVCGILIGARHLEKAPTMFNGRAYCSYCYAMELVGIILGTKPEAQRNPNCAGQ
jgi:hypothetical protein